MKNNKLKNLININNWTKYEHLGYWDIPLYWSWGLMRYVDDYLYEWEAVLLPRKWTLNNIMYTNWKIWTVDTMYYATVKEKIDSYYLYLYLSLLNLERLDSWSTLPSMTKESYWNIELDLLEYDEQIKISKLFKFINLKIELNNKINSELEKMAKTLYDYWFVQFDFPDENGKPYKSSGWKMVYDEKLKREIPEGWKVENLFDWMDVQYWFPFSTKKFTEEITNTPIVRIRDILKNTISLYSTEVVQYKYKLLKNDLLIWMDWNFHMNFWDKEGAYLNQRSVRIRSRGDFNISNFQAFFQLNPFIKAREKNISRTTVWHLSDKDFKSVFLINPKSNNHFNAKKTFDIFLDKIILNRIENQKLAELRDWLLPMLMNWQVSVK